MEKETSIAPHQHVTAGSPQQFLSAEIWEKHDR